MTDRTTSRAIWGGRALSILVVAILLADAATQLLAPHLLAEPMAHTGFGFETSPALGTVMLVCAITYALPRTAVLGAILTTGFFGGAIAAHARINELLSPPSIVCLLLGMAAWGGLYLRDARLRALLPLVR